MSMTGQGRTPDERDRLPIFTSVGQRNSRRAATAILVLLTAAVATVVAVVVVNSLV